MAKDKFKGKNIDEWNKAIEATGVKYEEIDIAPALSACLAVKDEEEVVMYPLLWVLSVSAA